MAYLKFLLTFSIIILFTNCNDSDTSTSTDVADNTNEEQSDKTYEIVVDDLDIPWGFAFLPDGSILIGEQRGDLILFKNGIKTSVSGMPEVYFRGQGGLMDITLHPDYESNAWIYISYSSSSGQGEGGNTAIMRAKLEGNTLVQQETLYKAVPNSTRGQHFGSRIVFDSQGQIYFTIGDRGDRDVNPQDITRDGGKVYRLNADGSIPSNNPFYNQASAKKAIYSYGHRNPQGMDVHPDTGAIWTHEHGPRGGDEVNIIEEGANYGWPVISYGINYDGTTFTDQTAKEGMEQPLHYWDPSIAPSGMAFVSSDVYPQWKGNLLIGSLKFQYIARLELSGNDIKEETKLLEGIGRVRTIKQGPDGFIYVGVENVGIIKLLPQS